VAGFCAVRNPALAVIQRSELPGFPGRPSVRPGIDPAVVQFSNPGCQTRSSARRRPSSASRSKTLLDSGPRCSPPRDMYQTGSGEALLAIRLAGCLAQRACLHSCWRRYSLDVYVVADFVSSLSSSESAGSSRLCAVSGCVFPDREGSTEQSSDSPMARNPLLRDPAECGYSGRYRSQCRLVEIRHRARGTASTPTALEF
jgi:hypothetical protein